MSPLRPQHGYLMEVPILMAVIAICAAMLLPRRPPMGQKVLSALATVPVLLCLYYMIVNPGWQPGQQLRLRGSLRWIAFLLVAASVLCGAGLFLLA